jgi:hypothetical protein
MSRISVKHVVQVLKGFTEFKKWLVNEIGFGGILNLQVLQKLSLKFSAWTMNKVDGHRRAICINENEILRLWAEDVHKIFGVPCGSHDVKGTNVSITKKSIDFIKSSLGMDKAGARSLHAAEEFIKRDIRDESSKLEKDCFQIAFFMFVIGHLLAPSIRY